MSYFTPPCREEVNALVPEEEEPQGEGIDGSAIVEDDEVVSIDATVSSTLVSVMISPLSTHFSNTKFTITLP